MKKLFAMTVAVLLLFSVLLGIPAAYGQAPETGKTLDILFSHDTHSHLNTFTTVVEDEETDIGGFARANTLIKAQRAKDPDTLVIDGGDFSMGTLIQTVFETQAAELRMLGYMGYDVTTFGNHEFDYRSKGLANMLTSARTSGDAVPAIVVCNVDWDAMEAAGLTEGQQMLKDAFTAYGVQDYTMVQKGDVRIAVVGVFGKDALSCAPTCELKFKDPVQAVKATVAEIKANENVDMIVCVSHSGTWDDPKKSEDELLAKGVPDLDLILSGHTHSRIREPIRHGGHLCGLLRRIRQKFGQPYHGTKSGRPLAGDQLPADPHHRRHPRRCGNARGHRPLYGHSGRGLSGAVRLHQRSGAGRKRCCFL